MLSKAQYDEKQYFYHSIKTMASAPHSDLNINLKLSLLLLVLGVKNVLFSDNIAKKKVLSVGIFFFSY